MTARAKEVSARYYLLHLGEIPKIWHQKQWEALAVVVEYAKNGIPRGLSKTDPAMYKCLCAALADYHIRGYDEFDLDLIRKLAESQKI
jgi:hypothetical protein